MARDLRVSGTLQRYRGPSMRLSRRETLFGLAGLAIPAQLRPVLAAEPSLAASAQAAGLTFGTSIAGRHAIRPEAGGALPARCRDLHHRLRDEVRGIAAGGGCIRAAGG